MQQNDFDLLSPTIVLSEEIKQTDVLCVLERHAKEYFPVLQSWLEEDSHRTLIIMHETVSLGSFLDVAPRIKSFALQEPFEEVFKQIAWEHVFLRVKLWLPMNEVWQHEPLFNSCLMGVHLVASGEEDFGVRVISNIRTNTLSQKTFTSFSALEGSMEGIPAIICGAGPSLTDDMGLLGQLRTQAALFAGGTAIGVLSGASVAFHAAAGIDPDPDYERFLQSCAFETPFFYQDRFSSEILAKTHAEKVRLPSGPGSVFEEWLKEACGRQEVSFDSGWTVATQLTALATHMGCHPIIFVGMDFGYVDKMYADGIGSNEELLLQKKDKIQTKSDWVMATDWLSDWIQTHPSTLFINTSKMSMFSGAKTISLQEAKEIYLTENYDIASLLHRAIQQAKVKGSPSKAEKAFEELDESLVRTKRILEAQVGLFAAYHPIVPTSKGEFILLEYDLYDELCYKVLIEPVWTVWRHVFARIDTIAEEKRRLHQILFFQKILEAHLSLGINT